MTTTAARPAEAPVIMWETFEGETIGYDVDGNRIVEVTARVRESSWERGTNVRSWFVKDADGNTIAEGEADGLRASKQAIRAAFASRAAATATEATEATRQAVAARQDALDAEAVVRDREADVRRAEGEEYLAASRTRDARERLAAARDVLDKARAAAVDANRTAGKARRTAEAAAPEPAAEERDRCGQCGRVLDAAGCPDLRCAWWTDGTDPDGDDGLDEDTCRVDGCDESLDDGEGYDGMCGTHADRADTGEECDECDETLTGAPGEGHGMCGSCLHNAYRSGWTPAA